MIPHILFLQIRPEDDASQGEYEAIIRFGQISPEQIHRVRMDQTGVPTVNLNDYTHVIIGGGPWNPGDPIEKKTATQQQVEQDLIPFIHQLIKQDVPTLGICYGLEIVIHILGGEMTREYKEPVGAVDITLNEEGTHDPLLHEFPNTFRAFVGHKESAKAVTEGGVLLASSPACPTHLIRYGKNIYLTQFHPDLDIQGVCDRTDTYKSHGYFPEEEAEEIKTRAKQEHVTWPQEFLRRFIWENKR